MLGPPTPAQQPQPPQQPYPQYQGQPQQQPQYAQQDTRQQQQPPQHGQQQPYPSNPHPQSGEMNPYQQYAYGQPPSQYSQHPSQQQHQLQQQPQPHPSQQQHQLQQAQRGYMQNQLPPLSHSMGQPPPSYMPGAPPQMQQQPGQPPLGPPSIRPPQPVAPPKAREMSFSSSRGGYTYSLEVVQQPQRARMCGFGDKDRRPITPPPCVRLVITDDATGREVDIDQVNSDASFFLLQCDLWSENADREANVVRASSNSPAVSISSATTTSYPPPQENAPRHMHEPHQSMYIDSNGQPVYSTMPGGYAVLHRTGSAGGYPPGYPHPPPPGAGGPPGYYHAQIPGHPPPQVSYMPPQAAQPNSAMYTRNLIGSLTVNAARLNDHEKKPGYWFVLQDLSVRTEGYFRLKMGFVDISAPADQDPSSSKPPPPPPAASNGPNGQQSPPVINRGKTKVLAWVFSDKFQVYSAKKFPGVIESTPLSKAFAQQGIKIPIRKDNKGDDGEDGGEGDD